LKEANEFYTTFSLLLQTMPPTKLYLCLLLLLCPSTRWAKKSILATAASHRPQNFGPPPHNRHPFEFDPNFQMISESQQAHALGIVESTSSGNQLDRYHAKSSPGFLTGVVLVAATNLMINVLRPDDTIVWQVMYIDCSRWIQSGQYPSRQSLTISLSFLLLKFRMPRILWEFCLMITATIAKFPSSAVSHTSSLIYLTLSTMLWTTALTDIFLWAPFFALWAGTDNQDCSGGWFTGRPYVCVKNHAKGYGRLLVRENACLSKFPLASVEPNSITHCMLPYCCR
jgi:hypothetical protein